jgi:uncharacterized OB-fold protein
MSMSVQQIPGVPVVPDASWPVSAPFWDAAKREVLSFPQCASCGRFEWYPIPMCKHCGAREWEWPEVDPTGTIYSFTVLRRAFLPGLEANVPFPVLQVRFDAAPGVTLVTGLADLGQRDLVQIGAPIRMRFVEVGDVSVPFAEVVASPGAP